MLANTIKKAAMALVLSAPYLAHAELGIYVKGGTTGVGGGIGYGISDNLSVRAGYTALDYDHDIDTSDVNYSGTFKLGGGEAMLDWHPFGGTFRVTAGAVISRQEVDVEAKLNQNITINGVIYHASDVGNLGGTVEFNSTMPYVGIGWGNVVGREGNLHFVADIGVLYQGSPNVKLHGSCTASFQASNPQACSDLTSNIHAEEKSLEDEVSNYEWWPVISIGLAYRF